MGGSTLSSGRWIRDPAFYRERVFKGSLLDIGGSADPLWRQREYLPHVTEWTIYDLEPPRVPDGEYLQGDAHTLPQGRTWDVVYASHVLEHLDNPYAVARSWWPAVNPGGHLVIIVPSWELYERGQWPSRRNGDHKTAWIMGPTHHRKDVPLRSLLELVLPLPNANLLRASTLDQGWIKGAWDQTATGGCESSLEVVVQRVA